MNATIDWGNTRAKLGLFDNQQLLRVDHFNIKDDSVAKKISDWLDVVNPQRIIWTNSGEPNAQVKELLEDRGAIHFSHQTPVVHSTVYTTRDTLGLDRILLCEAAFHEFPKTNCLIIDMGTCITYDLVDNLGVHRGGSIAPGWRMRLQAMHSFTAKLPEAEAEISELIGTSTLTALQSGAYHGMRNELLETIRQYEERYSPLHVITTGGDAEAFALQAKKDIFARPNYTLLGLNAIIHQYAQ
ncbi:MAG: type III pantothenate kinase [Flavobacteriia bacterium]|nr:type III pantothenate kinase [Flavobacteriia bacterium]